jgi:nitroreductase/FMN reductase [NAD(P)H]
MAKMIAELIERRFGLPSTVGRDSLAEGELAAVLSHRTQRRYNDAPVSEDLMQQVLAAGLSAPAKSDLRQHRPGKVRLARRVAELVAPTLELAADAAVGQGGNGQVADPVVRQGPRHHCR